MDFSFWVSVGLIWILFFWIYRDYRVDLFRERLFGIRDSLFDMAEAGEISFDSPAYGILRSTINGTIQFGHRLTLFEFVALMWASENEYGDNVVDSYRQRWQNACRDLSPATQAKLDAIRTKVHFQVTEQIIMTSSLMMFTLLAVVFAVSLAAVKNRCLAAVRRVLDSAPGSQITDRFDSAALTQAA